jgi:RNA binding exosome subunit
MNKKLTKKESEEVVTKGYYHDTLDEILDVRFNKFRKEINKDFKFHIDSLMENYIDQLQALIEGFDDKYVLRKEWETAK